MAIAWVILLSLFGFWSCTESQTDSTIRFGLATAPTNLDPRFATDAASARINRLLYSRLVDFAEDATPIPSLATWKIITPTHYRFYLQEPLSKFHNGRVLTAEDVRATFTSVLNPQTVSPHRGLLQNISRIEAPSKTVVDFYLTHPDPLFPGYVVIGILPANLIASQHPFYDHPIGSGTFRFEAKLDDTRVTLRRQEDGQLFEFIEILDPTVRTMKLLAGEIHLLQNDLPPELVTYLTTQPSILLQRHRGSNFAYLGFNHRDAIVGRLLIRKAIAHAIHRERIIDYVFGKRARLANALFPPDHWLGTSNLQGYRYDPELSKTLLRQAGFSDQRRPSLIYKTSTDPFRLRLATIIQDQLHQVGIDIAIQSHDWGTFYGDIKTGRFQMYSLSWVGLKTPDIFRHIFHSEAIPPLGANRGKYANPQTDHLIVKAEQAVTPNQQRVRYRALQTQLVETLPYIPLWYEDHYVLYTPKIEGYGLRSDGNYDGLLNVQWAPPASKPQTAGVAQTS